MTSTSTGATWTITDVEKCLGLLTFLPMDEVRRLGALKDSQINEAKKVLAYEVTKLVHGEEEAQKAADAAAALFAGGASAANVPSFTLTRDEFAADSRVTTMLVKSGLCKSQQRRAQSGEGGCSAGGGQEGGST